MESTNSHCGEDKKDFFISYNIQDDAWAEWIAYQLESNGYKVVFAKWDFQPGNNFILEMNRAAKVCKRTLIVLSPNYLDALYTQSEWAQAFSLDPTGEKRLLIPIRVAYCELHGILNPLIYIDFFSLCNAPPSNEEELAGKLRHRLFQGVNGNFRSKPENAPPLPIKSVANHPKSVGEDNDILKAHRSSSYDFLDNYRARISCFRNQWNFSQIGIELKKHNRNHQSAPLEKMYQPLHFSNSICEPSKYLTPLDLLCSSKPIIINGFAGSGKTTWIRWTFLQLLKHDNAFPLIIELRALALKWKNLQMTGKQRSIDVFLEEWIAEHMGFDLQYKISDLLKQNTTIKPVLLIDGWDELGDLGEELRTKVQGLLKEIPHLKVVVTSRPYGQARPSYSSGFEEFDVQPMSDSDIRVFCIRYFGFFADECDKSSQLFINALDRSPDIMKLAGNPLLLTLMFFMSNSGSLPDKKHQLYHSCIENVLSSIPERKEEEGAMVPRQQWRPQDSDERFEAVAQIALKMLEENNGALTSRDNMFSYLPSEWHKKQKSGFLNWLIESSGLLVERTDGTLGFIHLSFQEYLAAYKLNSTHKDNCNKEFEVRLQKKGWWNTLHLWAYILDEERVDFLNSLLDSLLQYSSGIRMAGSILANGLGGDEYVEQWLHKFCALFHHPYFLAHQAAVGKDYLDYMAKEWSACSQVTRKNSLEKELKSIGSECCSWLLWLRLKNWYIKIGLGDEFPLPKKDSSAFLFLDSLEHSTKSDRHIAVGRILVGSSPSWPQTNLELSLLHLWPSHRRLLGYSLQTLVLLFPEAKTYLHDLALNRMYTPKHEYKHRAAKLASYLVKHRKDKFYSEAYVRTLAREVSGYWERYFPENTSFVNWAGGYFRWWTSNLFANAGNKWIEKCAPKHQQWIDCFANELPGWACNLGADLGEFYPEKLLLARLGIEEIGHPMLYDYAWIEFFSFGRVCLRSILAESSSTNDPLYNMFIYASRLSLYPDSNKEEFFDAIDTYSGSVTSPKNKYDPLWIALAKHISRQSTQEDIDLLHHRAMNPDSSNSPLLRLGLKYTVRGDFVCEDNSEVTLNELADKLKVPHLPYIERMIDELNIDWLKDWKDI